MIQTIFGFDIPAGHQVCVSPTTNQRLPDSWKDFDKFMPDRYALPSDNVFGKLFWMQSKFSSYLAL